MAHHTLALWLNTGQSPKAATDQLHKDTFLTPHKGSPSQAFTGSRILNTITLIKKIYKKIVKPNTLWFLKMDKTLKDITILLVPTIITINKINKIWYVIYFRLQKKGKGKTMTVLIYRQSYASVESLKNSKNYPPSQRISESVTEPLSSSEHTLAALSVGRELVGQE